MLERIARRFVDEYLNRGSYPSLVTGIGVRTEVHSAINDLLQRERRVFRGVHIRSCIKNAVTSAFSEKGYSYNSLRDVYQKGE